MFVNNAIIFGCPLIHWVVDPEDEYAEFECDVTEQYSMPCSEVIKLKCPRPSCHICRTIGKPP